MARDPALRPWAADVLHARGRAGIVPPRAFRRRGCRANGGCALLLLGTLLLGGCDATPRSGGAGDPDPPESRLESGALEHFTPASLPVPGMRPAIIDSTSREPLSNLHRLAFPSARGFGAQARGGRGGVVLEVTTLTDGGPGSLRECVEAAGPRTCVFATGGTIVLDTALRVSQPFLTIAGQTAPGGGIQLRLSQADDTHVLRIATHDVVVRHLRLRRGATAFPVAPDGTCCGDAVVLSGAQRVILDHLSVGFATDENIDITRSSDVTVQNSIVAYGLRRSTHEDTVEDPEDHHSMGVLVGEGSTRVSLLRNLFAFNLNRNPRLQSGISETCGNWVYGSTANPISMSGGARANIVGNHFDPRPQNNYTYVISTDDSSLAHARGNTTPVDIWAPGASQAPSPFQSPACDDQNSHQTMLSLAGAWPRDSLDMTTVQHVRDGTGALIDDPSEVNGWPRLEPGQPPEDGDGDGIADAWEREVGLDSEIPEDRNDDFFDVGYTALEVYLAWLAQDVETDVPFSASPLSP